MRSLACSSKYGGPFKIHISELPKATPRAHVLDALSLLEQRGFPTVLDVKMFSTNTSTISSALVTLSEPVSVQTCEAWHGEPWLFGNLWCRPADVKKTYPCEVTSCLKQLQFVCGTIGVVGSCDDVCRHSAVLQCYIRRLLCGLR